MRTITQTMNKTSTNENILDSLANFTGTENYYKASPLFNINITDGIKYLCEKLQCYWLIDIIGSAQHLPLIKANSDSILWTIKKNDNNHFIVSAYKDSPLTPDNLLYTQKGNYTNFPLSEFEFYQCNNIILLKSEY